MQNDAAVVKAFAKLQFLVLDEADRLLDRAFEDELRVLLSSLPSSRQTLLFSATLTSSLQHLQRLSMRHAFQYLVRCPPPPGRSKRVQRHSLSATVFLVPLGLKSSPGAQACLCLGSKSASSTKKLWRDTVARGGDISPPIIFCGFRFWRCCLAVTLTGQPTY